MNVERERNLENLREINRDIACVVVFSSDGQLLMGRKDPEAGGVYPNAWHLPGGGRDEDKNESLRDAAVREAWQEAGLELNPKKLEVIPGVGEGQSVKRLKNGERVWCRMRFYRFRTQLDQTAAELADLKPGDDLVELRWFRPEELENIKQVPGGREFFIEAGYIPTRL